MNGWLNGWKNMSRVLFVVAVWYQNVWLADFVMEWWCLVCLSVSRFNVCCILVAIMKMVAMMMLLFCCLSCSVYRFSTAFRLRTGIIVLHFLFFWLKNVYYSVYDIVVAYALLLNIVTDFKLGITLAFHIVVIVAASVVGYCCYCCCCCYSVVCFYYILFGVLWALRGFCTNE